MARFINADVFSEKLSKQAEELKEKAESEYNAGQLKLSYETQKEATMFFEFAGLVLKEACVNSIDVSNSDDLKLTQNPSTANPQ